MRIWRGKFRSWRISWRRRGKSPLPFRRLGAETHAARGPAFNAGRSRDHIHFNGFYLQIFNAPLIALLSGVAGANRLRGPGALAVWLPTD